MVFCITDVKNMKPTNLNIHVEE